MKKLVSLALGVIAVVAAGVASAADAIYEEGTHYVELDVPIRTVDPGKVEVTEYFSYGCPHCFEFDPLISSWARELGEGVVFNRTPAVWNKDYAVYAQTYYTAEALNILDQAHVALFEAIHTERRRLGDPKAMAQYFSQFGVDPVEFAKIYKSFGVSASVQKAVARGRAYRARGVPTLIVNGKYRIEGQMAGSNVNMLRIAEFLIEKERQTSTADKPAS
tara:strand:- start:926 stop:1582 length:657 start_codon:yes stop_codon:yes gene_type:complete